MILSPESARVLHVDLANKRFTPINFGNRADYIGGSGLAAALYQAYGHVDAPPLDPEQPIIFAIGPLTGLLPAMSKAICGFRSPYTGEWAESHAGGRLALSMRFSGYDAIMLTGKAPSLSALVVGSRTMELHDVHYLKGKGVFGTGRELRRFGRSASGHRSTLRIGPAGENGVAYACINVDSFRHFGRLGSGSVLGSKNIKGIVVMGDGSYDFPGNKKELSRLYKEIYSDVTSTNMMQKYHDLGTAENLEPLNDLKALPWRNAQATTDQHIDTVNGDYIADNYLLRKSACSGCPLGCIHIANLRQQFEGKHEYVYKQVPYDYELIFAQGTMIGISHVPDILAIIDETESCGLDSMSTGVALAWATEAFEKGLISKNETLVDLAFGNAQGYLAAIRHITEGSNEFWQLLGKGALTAARRYGGDDFACVLGGQEMAGYATGEAYYVSHALGFRHSHLDAGGYSFDQSDKDKNTDATVKFFLQDEAARVQLTCMASCLFARKVYTPTRLKDVLDAAGFAAVAQNLESSTTTVQNLRWKLKFQTGYIPENQHIPKRLLKVVNWKGTVDEAYLQSLRVAYAQELRRMADE